MRGGRLRLAGRGCGPKRVPGPYRGAMHVAMFTDFHPDTMGGIQTSVHAQRRGLQRLGHRVTLFCAPLPGAVDTDPDVVVLPALGGVVVNGFAMVLPTRANARLIDAVFAARGPVDVVHTQTTYGVAIAGLRAARRHGIPVVHTVHSRDDVFIQHTSPAPYLAALAMRGLHGRFVAHPKRMPRNDESRAARHAWHTMVSQAHAADRVIVPTNHFAERLRAHGLDRPLRVISNGIDDELLDDARATAAVDLAPAPTRSLRVLWCARLSGEKRLIEAIEAVAAVPNCEFDIYGSGDLADRAQALIEARDLGARVRLHGGVGQAECLAAMAVHDVLLFPSSGFDTQGMALLEAAAMRLPVVYCDPDLAETVPEGGGVRTADPSVAAIAATLRELADDPELLAPMRKILTERTDLARQSRLTAAILAVYGELSTAAESAVPPPVPNVPTAPHRRPLLGHTAVVLRDGPRFVTGLAELGPIVRIYLGSRPVYLLTTPELIRAVGFGEAGRFHREELREAIEEVIREASNVLSGKPHELRRRMIAPALRQRRLHEYAVVAADLANTWSASLRPGQQLDLADEAHRVVLDIISSTLFTAEFGAQAKHEVQQNIPWLLGQVIQRAALPAPIRGMRPLANRRFARTARRLRAQLGTVVAEYRRADRDFHDVLSELVRHRDPETGVRLTDEEIIDELLLMLAAGVGSTASILGWVCHEIMRQPRIAAEIRREIREVVGSGPVTAEHVTRLPYLRAVIMETLRYWGPWVSTQTADGPITLGETILPDGATVAFSPYLIHHDPRHYPDPETFDPGRWLPDRGEEIDKKAILPFGVGHRHCPGSGFALMTITLATAALFARWQPVADPRYQVTASNRDFVPAPTRIPVVLHLAP